MDCCLCGAAENEIVWTTQDSRFDREERIDIGACRACVNVAVMGAVRWVRHAPPKRFLTVKVTPEMFIEVERE